MNKKTHYSFDKLQDKFHWLWEPKGLCTPVKINLHIKDNTDYYQSKHLNMKSPQTITPDLFYFLIVFRTFLTALSQGSGLDPDNLLDVSPLFVPFFIRPSDAVFVWKHHVWSNILFWSSLTVTFNLLLIILNIEFVWFLSCFCLVDHMFLF